MSSEEKIRSDTEQSDITNNISFNREYEVLLDCVVE